MTQAKIRKLVFPVTWSRTAVATWLAARTNLGTSSAPEMTECHHELQYRNDVTLHPADRENWHTLLSESLPNADTLSSLR